MVLYSQTMSYRGNCETLNMAKYAHKLNLFEMCSLVWVGYNCSLDRWHTEWFQKPLFEHREPQHQNLCIKLDINIF